MALESRPMNLTQAATRSTAWRYASERSNLFWLIPFAIAAGYGVLFLLQMPHNLWVIGWSSDYASGFTVPTTVASTGTGGHTVLGTSGAWAPLWFGLLTAKLPLHRLLWELAPTGLFVIAAAAVAWSVAQVASRRAALMSALLILVASPRALYFFMAPVAHNIIWPGTALLGAYLVWLAKGEHRAWVRWTVATLGGVVLGTFIASDNLLIATGVAPFAITAILAAVQRSRHSRLVAVTALTTAVIAVPVAKLTSSIMSSSGYVTVGPGTELAPLSTLSRHAELMWEGLKGLMNGYLSQATAGWLGGLLGVLCELAMVAALAAALVVGVLATARFVESGARGKAQKTAELTRSMHVIFWVGSAGATSVAWALSPRIEYIHESYYATVLFSVAAIVVLLASSRSPARWLISAGASVFFAASIVGLANHYMESYVLPLARSYQHTGFVPASAHYQSQIERFAKANGVSTGYAGYGDASSLTWISDERVVVRPVQLCNGPQGVSICPFFLERVPSWYVPQQRHTFLLVDTGESFLNGRPEDLGNPIAGATFGPVQMYIYPYDLAARMAPPSD